MGSPANSVKAMMPRKKRRPLTTTSAPAFRPIWGKLASGRLPTAILSKGPTQNRGKTRTTIRPTAAPSSGCQHHKWAERASLAETPTVTSVTTVSSVTTLLTGAPFSAPVNETSHFSPEKGISVEFRPDGEIRSSASGEPTVNLSNCLAARDGTAPLTSARNTVFAKATPPAQLLFLETNYRNTLYTSYEQIKLKPPEPK